MNKLDYHIFWKFIRGDLDNTAFENWLYNNDNLENSIGEDFYLSIISTDYRSANQVYSIKEKLKLLLLKKFPLDCECVTLSDIDMADMGSEKSEKIFDTLKEMKKYGELRWWLALFLCKKCNQYWLSAQRRTTQ